MGICPALSPQERVNKSNNKILKGLLQQKLKDLVMYGFCTRIRSIIPNMPNRYLFNEGILQDIESILHIVQNNKSIKSQSMAIDAMEDELKNSCLIIEDEMFQDKNQPNPHKSFNDSEYSANNMHQNTEYQKNLAQNESLVCQINIIYQRQFDIAKYHNSLKLFLKWSTMFSEHFYGGFLKPIYKQFCNAIYQMKPDDLDTIVDETGVFVQFMVSAYTDVYHLKSINQSQNGCLFKNQNVFNLIMTSIFKKTKIRKFIRNIIKVREEVKIKKLTEKLQQLKGKNLQFFGVQAKFRLRENQNCINESIQIKPTQNQIYMPYTSCLKAVQNLCQNSETPITKLKLIVQISKGITSQIYKFYDKMQKQAPDLDPDNLTGIIMYLIVKVNRPQLYEELKLAQYFTTSNCLTCISGYYLNTFNAAIQSLLVL